MGNEFLGKVTDAGKGVTGKMQNYSEVNNLRRKILYEEERIIEIFADIGKNTTRIRKKILRFSVLCVKILTHAVAASRRCVLS